jgi:hypothetical protein
MKQVAKALYQLVQMVTSLIGPDWLLVRLPGRHDEAFPLPGELDHYIHPNAFSVDVVMRRCFPGPRSTDSDLESGSRKKRRFC